jgi:hypothetical protein
VIPPESRGLLRSGQRHLAQWQERTTKSQARRLGTAESQKGHYISFVVLELVIKDPSTLSHLPWHITNVIMFKLVDHLWKGHTILNTTISGKTIEKYLIEAVDYCIEHGSTRCDPSMDPTSGQRLVAITKIIQDAKRWDKMTKHQEPLTKAMVAHLLEEHTATQPIDSHDRALVDWAKPVSQQDIEA